MNLSNSLFILTLSSLMALGCSVRSDAPGAIKIKFEPSNYYTRNFKSRAAADPFDYGEPQTFGTHYCYAVIVSSPLTNTTNLNTCLGRNKTTIISKPEIFVGYANRDQEITLNNLTPGKGKIIQIMGHSVQTSSYAGVTPLATGKCPTIAELEAGLYPNLQKQLFAPRLIGQTTIDIEPGNQTVEIPVSLSTSKTFSDCSGPMFEGLWDEGDDGPGDDDDDTDNIDHPNISYIWPEDGNPLNQYLSYHVGFNGVINTNFVTYSETPGTCTGTVQVSKDNFATCVGIEISYDPTWMSMDISLPTPPTVGSTYKLKLTSGFISGGENITPYVSALGNNIFNICDGVAGTSHTQKGTGTLDDPYILCSADQMSSLRTATNVGAAETQKVFMLGTNVDMTSFGTEPCIGTEANPFRGTFLGGGVGLSNIVMHTSMAGQPFGLFCKVVGDGNQDGVGDGEIRQLFIQSTSIQANASSSVGIVGEMNNGRIENIWMNGAPTTIEGYQRVGGLVGFSQNSVINNIYVEENTVMGLRNVGGLVGELIGNISNVEIFNGQVYATDGSLGVVGGVVGTFQEGTIENVGFKGHVGLDPSYMSNKSGGIVGTTIGASPKYLINVTSEALVAGYNEYAGGIIGYSTGGTFIQKSSVKQFESLNPSIFGTSHVGGFVGGGVANISRCENSAQIEASNNAGGIVGTAEVGSQISDCINYGLINAPGSNAGGIAGQLQGTATRTINTSPIWANMGAGGLVATGGANITHSINISDVSSASLKGFISSDTTSNTNYYYSGAACSGCSTGGSPVGVATLSNFYSAANPPYTNSGSGWDFTNIWEQGTGVMPSLRNIGFQSGY